MNLQPTLQNDLIILRPLLESDFGSLHEIARDRRIWEQHPVFDRYKLEVFSDFFAESLKSGGCLVAIDRSTNKMIGSSRYQQIPKVNNGIEIGWSFLSRSHWGGLYNGAMKKLMIDHAFQELDFIIFHIGKTNIRSQKAVEKIGGIKITDPKLGHLLKEPDMNFTYRIKKNMFP